MATTEKQNLAASDKGVSEQNDTLCNEEAVSIYPSGEVSDLSNWAMIMDESSGCYYYYNTVTSISTWEEPEGYAEYSRAKIEAELKLEVEQIRREEQTRINVSVTRIQCFARRILVRKLVQMKKAKKLQEKLSAKQSNVIEGKSETAKVIKESREAQAESIQPQDNGKCGKHAEIPSIVTTTREPSEYGIVDVEQTFNDFDQPKLQSNNVLEENAGIQRETRRPQGQFKCDNTKLDGDKISQEESDNKILSTDLNHVQNVDEKKEMKIQSEKLEAQNSQEQSSRKCYPNNEGDHQNKLKESENKVTLRRYMNTFWQASSVDQIVGYSWYPNSITEPKYEPLIDSTLKNANFANTSNANSIPCIIRPKSVGSFAVHVITTARKKRTSKPWFNMREKISLVEEKADSSKLNLLMKNRSLTAKPRVSRRDHSLTRPKSSSALIRSQMRSQGRNYFHALPGRPHETVHQNSKLDMPTLRAKARRKGSRRSKLKPLKYSKLKHAAELDKGTVKGKLLNDSEIEKLDSLKKAASGLKTLFALVDTSGDGYVDFKELQAAICYPNEDVLEILSSFPVLQSSLNDQNKVKYIFDALDVDESGQISEEQFISVLQELVKETEQEKLQKKDFKRLFDIMDHNSDEELDIHELYNALRLDPRVIKMVKLSPVLRPLLRPSAFHKIKDLHLRYDTDGSGRLNWDEFLRICKIAFPRIQN